MTKLPFRLPASQYDIIERRAQILSVLCAMDEGFRETPVRSIRLKTLSVMLDAYDALFFENCLRRAYGELAVTISMRLTSSAGKFLYIKNRDTHQTKAEIRMSGDFLMRLTSGPFELNGLIAQSPQEAFLMVFEHELCHAVEAMLYGSTGHSSRFLSLANSLFGHTEMKHRLPTRKSDAAKKGICVGKWCTFQYQGKTFMGQIHYVGKNATVYVPASGRWRIGDLRNRKFHVPLDQLKIL